MNGTVSSMIDLAMIIIFPVFIAADKGNCLKKSLKTHFMKLVFKEREKVNYNIMNRKHVKIISLIVSIIGVLILLIVAKAQFSDYYNLSGDKIPTVINVTGTGVIYSISVGSAGDDILQTYTYTGINNKNVNQYIDYLMIQEGFIKKESKEDAICLSRKSGEAGKKNIVEITTFEGKVTIHLEKIDE